MDVALGFHHKEGGGFHLCPFFRADSRWVSNWHAERKSPRDSAIGNLKVLRFRRPSGHKGLVRQSPSPVQERDFYDEDDRFSLSNSFPGQRYIACQRAG